MFEIFNGDVFDLDSSVFGYHEDSLMGAYILLLFVIDVLIDGRTYLRDCESDPFEEKISWPLLMILISTTTSKNCM